MNSSPASIVECCTALEAAKRRQNPNQKPKRVYRDSLADRFDKAWKTVNRISPVRNRQPLVNNGVDVGYIVGNEATLHADGRVTFLARIGGALVVAEGRPSKPDPAANAHPIFAGILTAFGPTGGLGPEGGME